MTYAAQLAALKNSVKDPRVARLHMQHLNEDLRMLVTDDEFNMRNVRVVQRVVLRVEALETVLPSVRARASKFLQGSPYTI